MSITHFNLKIGIVMILLLMFSTLCINSFYNTFIRLKWFRHTCVSIWVKRITQIILCIMVLIGGLTSFVSGKENIKVEVVDIQNKGHWAFQLCDDYSIDAVDQHGNLHYYTTVIFGNKNISSTIESLNVGDKCVIQANRWGTIYNIYLEE